jgi:hypothetical protein
MAYGKRKSAVLFPFLSRVKNLTDLIIGEKYYLRKLIKKEDNKLIDESFDIVLKEEKEGIMYDQNSEIKLVFSEYEVFIRKSL